MNRRITFVLAVAAIGLSGCGITPLQDVTAPATPLVERPDALAFSEAPPADGRPPIDGSPAAAALDTEDPAAWTVVTDSAQVGVHSAPDTEYTRLGVVGPGETVIATGRRVDAGGVRWMEIHWRTGTGWVVENAFTPRTG